MELRSARGISATLVLVLGLACGSDDAEHGAGTMDESSSEAGDSGGEPSLLGLCDAPMPCDAFSVDPGTSDEAANALLGCALDKVIDSLAHGGAAELTSSECDIGCSGVDLLVVGDGTAYRQSWTSNIAEGVAASYEMLEHCTLKPSSFFEACVGQPWTTDSCPNWSEWVTDCTPADTAQCP